MPYEVTPSGGLFGNLAGMAAGAASGYMQGEQQRYQRKMEEEQQAQQAQYYALQDQLAQQQIEEGKRKATQENVVAEWQRNLKTPKNWGSMSTQDKIAYLSNRAANAPDADTAATATNLMNALGMSDQHIAQAGELGARANLDKARAIRATQVHDEVMANINARLKIATQADRTRAQIAYQHALTQAQAMGYSFDERLAIAAITEQNTLNNQYRGQEFQAAIDQWKAQRAAVDKANALAAVSGGTQLPEPAMPVPPGGQGGSNVSVNFGGLGGLGGGSGVSMNTLPAWVALARENPGLFAKLTGGAAGVAAATNTGNQPSGPNVDPEINSEVKIMLKKLGSPAAVVRRVNQLVGQGKITRQQQAQIMQALSYGK